MRIENEDLLRIIKEELEGILREAEEAEKVDESLPSRLIGVAQGLDTEFPELWAKATS